MTFNPEALEAAVIEAENATTIDPLEEKDYPGVIKEYKFVAPNKPDQSPKMDVYWILDDPEQQAKLEREELVCRQTVWLDITEEGAIKTGPNVNVGLGRLREAIGLNKPGFRFEQLTGSAATVTVKQSTKEDDPTTIYSNVVKVSARS